MVELNFNSFMKSFIDEYNNKKYFIYFDKSIIEINNVDPVKYNILFDIITNQGPFGLSIKLFNRCNSLIYALIDKNENGDWILRHINLAGSLYSINLRSTEEEMFQRSLIESQLCEYEYVKFLRKLLKETITNINNLTGRNYAI